MFVNERQFNVPEQRDARVQMLDEWLDAGLDVGNHTYSHPRPDESQLWRYLDNIVQGEVVTRRLMKSHGKELVWFRYPYLATGRGEVAEAIENFLRARGYRIAPVTVSYADYNFAGPYARLIRSGNQPERDEYLGLVLSELDRAFERSEKRSQEVLGYELPQILLIHCNQMNSVTLRSVIQRIRDRGYSFVTLDEAMKDPSYDGANLRAGVLGGGGILNALAAAKKPD